MTSEDLKQELDHEPFVPLCLHFASGEKVDIFYPHTAWLRQNTLLVAAHPKDERASDRIRAAAEGQPRRRPRKPKRDLDMRGLGPV